MGCRHCGRDPVSRPRGLCRSCYYVLSIRDQYEPAPANVPDQANVDFCGCGQVPTEPCLSLPGTTAKILCLAERAAARQSLWHPRDLRLWHLPEPRWSQGTAEVEVED